jgi:hypothetical protein
MGSAVASVDLYCPVEVAGLAVLLWPVEGVEPVDLQRLAEEAGRLGFQRSAEEAGLAGFAMAGEIGLSNLHAASLKGCSTEYLLHAQAEDSHHHLLEHTQESSMMPA